MRPPLSLRRRRRQSEWTAHRLSRRKGVRPGRVKSGDQLQGFISELNAEPADAGFAVLGGMRKLDEQHPQWRCRKCDLARHSDRPDPGHSSSAGSVLASLLASPARIAISWRRVEGGTLVSAGCHGRGHTGRLALELGAGSLAYPGRRGVGVHRDANTG